MSIEGIDEGYLRKYLLGALSEAEQLDFEEQLVSDDELVALLLSEEDELVDDYLSEDLSKDERELFVSNFMTTPERRRKLFFGEALRSERIETHPGRVPDPVLAPVTKSTHDPSPRDTVPKPSSFRSMWNIPYLRWATATMIILIVGTGSWLAYKQITQPKLSRGMLALREAYANERPTESRITEWDYAPARPLTRGDGTDSSDYVKLDLARALIQLEANEHQSALAYHDLGRLYLAERDFNKAIEQFEKALNLTPENASIHSDLGAAYLERSGVEGGQNIADLAQALEHLDRALALDGALLPALFNRALCLQRMNARSEARAAWQTYIDRDPGSEWAREARRNFEELREQGMRTKEEVLQDFLEAYRRNDEPQAWMIHSQTKEMITRTMVPFHLANRLVKGADEGAGWNKETLAALQFVGDLEKRRGGDSFFADLAEYYATAKLTVATTLKRAQDSLYEGYRLCLIGRYKDALPYFEDAHRLFQRSGNQWEAQVVQYWQAYCLSYAGELERSSSVLTTLARDCHRRGYRWLESQSNCWLANNSRLLGEYSESVEHDKEALRIAAATNDLYMVQKTSSQVADDYKVLGRLREALEFNQQSLPSEASYFVSRRQNWRSLQSITDTLFALRLFSAAQAYQQEALKVASQEFNDAALIHNTYLRLGRIHAGKGDYTAATQAFQDGLAVLARLGNDPISKKLASLSYLEIARIKRQVGDYDGAVKNYQQIASDLDSSEFELYRYAIRKGLLLCHLLRHDDNAIQQELPVVMDLFERNRQRIKDEQSRNHFFDAEQGVYDLAIEYEYERHNKDEAFHYVELSRARSLQYALDAKARGRNDSSVVRQRFTLLEWQQSLPPGVQVVEYIALENRLLIWIITKTDSDVVEMSVSAKELEKLTSEYMRALMRSDLQSIKREEELAAQLCDLLFVPIESYLDEKLEVAIVPDKFLFRLPYAALRSRISGQRLVQKYTFLYSPSARVLILCSDEARMKTADKENETALSVGNPAFDQKRYKEFRDLESAATEARKVASLYRTTALCGEDAVKERIEPEMQRVDVIHFAAHYLVDGFSPAKSMLLLTSSGKSHSTRISDDLSLQEIASMQLPRVRLAVLSACQTGIESYYAGEGLIGLSRAFLIARIPLVVASQWPVDSHSTAELMIKFHEFRKLGNQNTTLALRNAQLAMLGHEHAEYHRPYYWAPFFALGGSASY